MNNFEKLAKAYEMGICGLSLKCNADLKDCERSNLFEKNADAYKDGVEFVVIIDEKHLNNTKKVDDVISAFAAKNIIRVSITANQVPHQEYYEISGEDVMGTGA